MAETRGRRPMCRDQTYISMRKTRNTLNCGVSMSIAKRHIPRAARMLFKGGMQFDIRCV